MLIVCGPATAGLLCHRFDLRVVSDSSAGCRKGGCQQGPDLLQVPKKAHQQESKLRYRDGKVVSMKGEKVIIENVGEDWDGGSRYVVLWLLTPAGLGRHQGSKAGSSRKAQWHPDFVMHGFLTVRLKAQQMLNIAQECSLLGACYHAGCARLAWTTWHSWHGPLALPARQVTCTCGHCRLPCLHASAGVRCTPRAREARASTDSTCFRRCCFADSSHLEGAASLIGIFTHTECDAVVYFVYFSVTGLFHNTTTDHKGRKPRLSTAAGWKLVRL